MTIDSSDSRRALSSVEAAEIAAMENPVLRNLRITNGYHDLTHSMRKLIGDKNVSWCAYATWASKTAGKFIRREDVPELIRAYIDRIDPLVPELDEVNGSLHQLHGDAHVHHSLPVELTEQILDDITSNVGKGNLIVFAELAPPFARMVETFEGKTSKFDQGELDNFLAPFKRGPVEDGGQDLLINAFSHYYQAIFEEDPKRKAELILFANNQVGYHEQIRLQGPIKGSLDAALVDPFVDAARGSVRAKSPGVLHAAIDTLLERALRPLGRKIEEAWHHVATRWLMRLELPDTTLDLGKDVVPLADGAMFAEELRVVTYEPLIGLLSKLDRVPDSSRDSAARDWANLDDRMAYVVDFFRSRQQDSALYSAPFAPEQAAVIRKSGLPAGPL